MSLEYENLSPSFSILHNGSVLLEGTIQSSETNPQKTITLREEIKS